MLCVCVLFPVFCFQIVLLPQSRLINLVTALLSEGLQSDTSSSSSAAAAGEGMLTNAEQCKPALIVPLFLTCLNRIMKDGQIILGREMMTPAEFQEEAVKLVRRTRKRSGEREKKKEGGEKKRVCEWVPHLYIRSFSVCLIVCLFPFFSPLHFNLPSALQ